MTASLVTLLSRSGTPRAVEASSKYFMVQSIARSLLLAGLLGHFLIRGTFCIFTKYHRISYCLILSGLFVKLAVFPNPFWFVDVVRGVSLLRSTLVVVISKIIPLYLFLCLSKTGWLLVLAVVGVRRAGFSSFLAIKQTNVRKIIALSSISNVGWMVVCFPIMRFDVCVFLFFCYIVMVLPVLITGYVSSFERLLKLKKHMCHPYLGYLLGIRMLSLGGLPPLVGFFYK